jgi:para-nitrobenzyl esterase
MQGPGTTYGENEPPCSENCLVLNVWTPAVADGGKRPVMVYCHGGGYTTGSGGSKDADGSHLAATYDVVVVATNPIAWASSDICISGSSEARNTRALAIRASPTSVAALRWVRANIAAFGGDPHNVMICGESGGAFKVGTLLAMPSAEGLFTRPASKAARSCGASLRRMRPRRHGAC